MKTLFCASEEVVMTGLAGAAARTRYSFMLLVLTHVNTQSSGIPTYSFNNIRYAEAPVGDLRFRASIPPQTINRTVNTGENNVICPQAGSGSYLLFTYCIGDI